MSEVEAGPEVTPEAKRRALMIGAGALVVAAVGIYALTHSRAGDARAALEANKVAAGQAVTVVTVQSQPFERRMTIAGEARPREDVRVYAPASGVRILQFLVDEGDFVRAGQPLARLDASLSNAQTMAAQASVKEAQVAFARAEAEWKRAESIRGSGALSDEAIESRKAQSEAANARLAAARAQLAEVNARLQGGYVRAPTAGLVIDRTAQLGAPVDGQSLFRIAGGNALEVGAELSESDILSMKPGQKATFRMVDGTSVEATLRRIPASIDSRTRTGEAVFDLARGGKLRAGMFLRGEVTLPAQERLAAPQSAVVFNGPEAFVYVVDDQNRARRTPVFVGLRSGDLIAIERGLTEGVRVAAGGAAFLQDGDLVRTVDPSAPGQAPRTAAKTAARDAGG